VPRSFRFLALVSLVGAILVPAPAHALTYVQINAETFATGTDYCGSATNAFAVPSYETLAVIGETGRLTGSCSISLADGARVHFQHATLKSLSPAGILLILGGGRSALTMSDSTISVAFQYVNVIGSPSPPASGAIDIVRTLFDGPSVILGLCSSGRMRITESKFEHGTSAPGFILFIISKAPQINPCPNAFHPDSVIEVLNSSFDTGGGTVAFIVYDPPNEFGKLIVRQTTIAPGDKYVHLPNPTS
jgi:hypothetical protein